MISALLILLIATAVTNAGDPLCADLDPNVIVLFPSELWCNEYYQCYNYDLSILHCNEGLWYSNTLKNCVLPQDSDCTVEALPTGVTQTTTSSTTTSPQTSRTTSTTTESTTTLTSNRTPTVTSTTSPITITTTFTTRTTPTVTSETTITTKSPTTQTSDTTRTTSSPTSITTTSTTWTPTPTPTPNPTPSPTCADDNIDYLPHPYDCTKYLECYNGESYEMQCPKGYWFNIKRKICVLPEASDCVHNMPTCENVPDNSILLKAIPGQCNLYLECYGKVGFTLECEKDLLFNEPRQTCDFPELVDCYLNMPNCKDVPFDAIILKPIPGACNKYIECFGTAGFLQECEDGLLFNEKQQSCDFPELVECS